MGKCHSCGERMDLCTKRSTMCFPCAVNATTSRLDKLERAFRVKVWNEAKAKGLSDKAAMGEIQRQVEEAWLSEETIHDQQT